MFSHSSPCPSCFRPQPPATDDDHPLPISPETNSGDPNISTTCFYQTDFGLFKLTWSRSFLGGHSLLLQLHHRSSSPNSLSKDPSLSTVTFHLHIKPFLFWNKTGSKRLRGGSDHDDTDVHVSWDLSKAKFGSRPDPKTRFFIAVVVDKEMALLVGDLTKEAHKRTKFFRPDQRMFQAPIMRREHAVFGKGIYTAAARFGGKDREISIDCSVNNDARLCFSVDDKRLLIVKKLKWKFRGNERIEVDGLTVQVSWDLYNWLFDHDNKSGDAIFMFRFETQDNVRCLDEECFPRKEELCNENGGVIKIKGKEWMRVRNSSCSSSISMSSASSSGCSSSVMEWTSVEETKLSGDYQGFSLLVHAWRK